MLFKDLMHESSKEVYPVFVMLSHTGSVVSYIIRKATGHPYSHAAISFDTSMKNMYSFGSGKLSRVNYIVGGFAKEDLKDITQYDHDTSYSLYVTFVPKIERDIMFHKLNEISDKNSAREMKYNFIGLLYNKFNIEHHRSDAYFCSQFVDAILKTTGKGTSKHSSLVKPYDLAKLKHFSFVTKGIAARYDEGKVKRKIRELSAKTNKTLVLETNLLTEGGFIELPDEDIIKESSLINV